MCKMSDVTEHDIVRSLADPYFPGFNFRAGGCEQASRPTKVKNRKIN